MAKPARFLFHLLCFLWADASETPPETSSFAPRQHVASVSAVVGASVALPCVYDNDLVARFFWYKQAAGQRPRLLATFFKFKTSGAFQNEFEEDARLSLETARGRTRLRIRDVRASDAATYYCVSSSGSAEFRFAQSVSVSVNGSGSAVQAVVHRSRGSGTLSCTVRTGTSDGDYRVYWFENLEDSQPGLVYTHADGKDRRERRHTHTCYYDLPTGPSQPGTYHCAVASCGHIVFGLNSAQSEGELDSSVVVFVLSGGVVLNLSLSLLLGFCLCLVDMRRSSRCADSAVRRSGASTIQTEALHTGDTARVSVGISGARRRRDGTWTECVYFSVKQ